MAHIIGLTGQSGAGKTTVSHIFEENGFVWSDLTSKYRDPGSLINRVSKVLCENITPKRRNKKLKDIPELTEHMIDDLEQIRASGTSRASNKFMIDSIEAFLNGDTYGNFQANFLTGKKTKKNRLKMRRKTVMRLAQSQKSREKPKAK